MKKYFYSDGAQKHGPFSLEDLKGEGIGEDTLIWFEGLDDWTPARKFEGILSFLAIKTPLPDILNEVTANKRKRHVFITCWLIWGIFVNAYFAYLYLFNADQALMNLDNLLPTDSQRLLIVMLGIMSSLNILFYILLIKWNKIGFYGIVVTGLSSIVINLYIGYDLILSFFGLIGILILYSILQLKKNGVSAWQLLEEGQ